MRFTAIALLSAFLAAGFATAELPEQLYVCHSRKSVQRIMAEVADLSASGFYNSKNKLKFDMVCKGNETTFRELRKHNGYQRWFEGYCYSPDSTFCSIYYREDDPIFIQEKVTWSGGSGVPFEIPILAVMISVLSLVGLLYFCAYFGSKVYEYCVGRPFCNSRGSLTENPEPTNPENPAPTTPEWVSLSSLRTYTSRSCSPENRGNAE